MTWASVISLCRIVLTPFIAFFIVKQKWLFTGVAFSVAALSDVLDGAVARFFNQKTFLGKWLDALADKMLIIMVFSAFYSINLLPIPGWFLLLVVAREMALVIIAWSFYRCFGFFSIEPSMLAKINMLIYVAIILLLIMNLCGFINGFYWSALINISAVCTVVAFIQHLYQGAVLRFCSKRVC